MLPPAISRFKPRQGSASDQVAAGLSQMPQPRESGLKGRGVRSSRGGRFERLQVEAFDDGWGQEAGEAGTHEPAPGPATEVRTETARTIIARNSSPDIGFDRSINMYRGCEHGCTYCYARPSHAWLGLSPGLDFETRLIAKTNAARLLEQELAAPGYQAQMLALGTNTDPYQPIERTHRLTRSILEVLEACDHPVGVVTKSALVARDADILGRMARKGLAKVAISITTLDRKLARAMEPRASAPHRRLEAIKVLADAGVPVAVNASPIIPGLTDHELESILEAAKAAGAQSAGWILVRLPLEVAELFKEWLLDYAPDRYRKVMGLIREARGGRDNVAAFGARMRGEGEMAALIRNRYELAIRRLGLTRSRETRLRTDLFKPPVPPGGQLSLL